MTINESNDFLNNKSRIPMNSNYYSSINNHSTNSLLCYQINQNNKRNNYLDSELSQYYNNSIIEEIKYRNEAKEVLNELRAKYLPNSIRRRYNSINQSQTMINFNDKEKTNLFYTTLTDYKNNIGTSPNISTEKIDYYKSQKENSRIFQNSLLDKKELNNVNESIKINESFKNSHLNLDKTNSSFINNKEDKLLEEKSNLNEYLIKENEKLKKLNKNYELLITPLIEYINDINYCFGQNTIDFHIINHLIKNKELNNDYNSLNDLKSFPTNNKNNIINSYKNRKINSNPKNKLLRQYIYTSEINNNQRSYTFNKKDKDFIINNYKPIIADRKNENFEKNTFKNFETGNIKRAKTFKEKMPKTFWSQNKKVKFVEK